jgi:hypothetical protein
MTQKPKVYEDALSKQPPPTSIYTRFLGQKMMQKIIMLNIINSCYFNFLIISHKIQIKT